MDPKEIVDAIQIKIKIITGIETVVVPNDESKERLIKKIEEYGNRNVQLVNQKECLSILKTKKPLGRFLNINIGEERITAINNKTGTPTTKKFTSIFQAINYLE